MKIVVLGAGPAGLLAAHAASLAGAEIIVAGIKRKSHMFGAQYLHEWIPNIDTGDPRHIKYELRGSAADYRRKVYGPSWGGSVSPEDLAENHFGYDIRRVYGHLWNHYGPYVTHAYFDDSFGIGSFVARAKPDLCFSSLPASLLCRNAEHSFQAQQIWAVGDAPEMGVFCPVSVPDDTVICDGTSDVSWYRASRVFEYSTAEWTKKPPIEGVAMVMKPLKNNCDCLPDLIRLGRYGKWEKGVLSHTAFFEAQAKIEEWKAKQ